MLACVGPGDAVGGHTASSQRQRHSLPCFTAQGGLLTADIKWNFTKFLVDREGRVVKRYASTTTPKEIESDIKNYL